MYPKSFKGASTQVRAAPLERIQLPQALFLLLFAGGFLFLVDLICCLRISRRRRSSRTLLSGSCAPLRGGRLPLLLRVNFVHLVGRRWWRGSFCTGRCSWCGVICSGRLCSRRW